MNQASSKQLIKIGYLILESPLADKYKDGKTFFTGFNAAGYIANKFSHLNSEEASGLIKSLIEKDYSKINN